MDTIIYEVSIEEVGKDYKDRFEFKAQTPLTSEGVASIIKAITSAMTTNSDA